MPTRKRGGNPEKAVIPPRLKKDGYLPETALCVSGRHPKKLTKGKKRVATSPPDYRFLKKGKGGLSPSYTAATRDQTPKKGREWQLVEKNKKREGEERDSCALCAGT